MSSAEETGGQPANVRTVLTMVRWLLYLAFIVIGFFILRRLAPVLAPIVAAAGVAYLLDGWVDDLVARGMKRVVAVSLLLVLFLVVVTVLIAIAVPLITEELRAFIAALPEMLQGASGWLAANLGIELPPTWSTAIAEANIGDLIGQHAGPLALITAGAVNSAFGLLAVLAELLLVPVFAFYIMLDWDHIVRRVESIIPVRYRDNAVEIATEIDGAVASWIRGQLIVTSILGVLYAVAFKIIGVQMGLVIGAIVGLLTIIPFLGTFVGAILTGFVVLFDPPGTVVILAIVGVFVVLHLLEAAVLTPKLVGKRVGLGELGALFAVLAGGKLLGFVGVLLAVPLAASVAVLVRRAFRYYEDSDFFNEPDGGDSKIIQPE